jgi:L-fuconolactonase
LDDWAAREQLNRDEQMMQNFWIDAHHHLWSYNPEEYPWMSDRMDVLRRDFEIGELQTLANAHSVLGTVAVQARQTLAETDWLLDIAERTPLLRGVVGWVPLISPDLERDLERLRARPILKSVRHVLHDEPDPNYMLCTDFNAGIRLLERYDLRYDLLIFAEHLPQTIEFVDRHPNQIFVLDHIAKPRIADGEIATWSKQISALSERQNVFCKISGMITEAIWQRWSEAQLEPYFDTILSAFGSSRLMFGSDWPVLTLASSYACWIDIVGRMIQRLSGAEAEDIMWRTAQRVYGLTLSSESIPSTNQLSCATEDLVPRGGYLPK